MASFQLPPPPTQHDLVPSLGAGVPQVQVQLQHLLCLCPCTSYSTSPSLSFFTWKWDDDEECVYVVSSKEMAVLSMGPEDNGSSGGPQGAASLR